MLNIVRSNRFIKDLRLAIKRGYKIELLEEVVNKLANQEELPEKFHDHPLLGEFKDFRECHIQPDWLLIYSVDDEELELYLFRTGTHSDLS
ncbi:MAG: type II toxin-antitoxin system YafQ family toxin [Spirochaetia bacterium]|nr:type II toxin-antitoxin system YafQ family toxin [Spirochaetia bacterium]